MNPPSYLIDTNILIQAILKKKGRWEFLKRIVAGGGSLACSVVTTGEIYAGMKEHEKDRTEQLLSGFDEFPVTGEIARHAGLLKNEWAAKGYTLTLADMLIAATAILHRQVLVTENRKHFPIQGIVLLPLPEDEAKAVAVQS